MTIAVHPSIVADSISELSINNVSVRSVDNIPQSPALLCPIMFPQPDGFITDISSERVTFGTNGQPNIDFSYTLHYVFLLATHGGGIGAFDYYAAIMEQVETIIEVIMGNDTITGVVDINLNSIDALGVIESQDGERYWGALFSFRCLEYVNA